MRLNKANPKKTKFTYDTFHDQFFRNHVRVRLDKKFRKLFIIHLLRALPCCRYDAIHAFHLHHSTDANLKYLFCKSRFNIK